MSIWHTPFPLEQANQRGAGCANGHLGIELTEVGEDFLAGRMPVDARTRQPAGAITQLSTTTLTMTLGAIVKTQWIEVSFADPQEQVVSAFCKKGEPH